MADVVKKAIKDELKSAFKKVVAELTDQQNNFSEDEKKELREYIEKLSDGTSHTYSHIFIKRKINEIINRRKKLDDALD